MRCVAPAGDGMEMGTDTESTSGTESACLTAAEAGLRAEAQLTV